MTDTTATPDITDEDDSTGKAWIDQETGQFADFTIEEQLLWEDNNAGSFGDIDIVFQNLQMSQARDMIENWPPDKIAGIVNRSWKLPTAIRTYEDEVVMMAAKWLRLTDASYPAERKLRLVDLVEATLAAMRYSMTAYDNMTWMAHMVYVIERRQPEFSDMSWEDWKKQAKGKETELTAAQILVDYTTFCNQIRPKHRRADKETAPEGEESPLEESTGESERQPTDTTSTDSPSTSA